MTIAFACAISHAPGMVAWADKAPEAQRNALFAGFETIRQQMNEARLDELILFTSEHWANFFLNHISPYCIGRAEAFTGPIEPWLKVEKKRIKGDPALAAQMVEHCYENEVEPGYSYEMDFDHGTFIPLHFLRPEMDLPVVPVMINTLAKPQPSPRRCAELGRLIGDVARQSDRRIGLVATGGMSHDPGEVGHGDIDTEFDQKFLAQMVDGDLAALSRYSVAELGRAGAGAIELLGWIGVAGALQSFTGKVVAYEAVVPWASGIGAMTFTALN